MQRGYVKSKRVNASPRVGRNGHVTCQSKLWKNGGKLITIACEYGTFAHF